MKAPSVSDVAIVVVVFTMMQAAFAAMPSAQAWWAPVASSALLAGLKMIQIYWPQPKPAEGPDGAAAAPAPQEKPGRVRQFLID